MKYKLYFVLIVLFIPISVYSQFSVITRGLKKEQPSTAFNPLKYKSLDDKEISGYGFVNPVDFKSIVFIKEKPIDTVVKNWEDIKVKSAIIYRDSFKQFVNKILDLGMELDSAQKQRLRTKTTTLDDTLNVFYLRKMKGAVAHGLRQLIYKNDEIRMFKFLPSNYFTIPKLVLFQTTELPVYESDTYFLNYNNQKAFKRSVKKGFKKCPKLIENAEKGKYYPDSKAIIREFAEDYKNLCSGK